MARTIFHFYLLGSYFAFLITLWVGSKGASVSHVYTVALFSWPLAAYVLLARTRLNRILDSNQAN